MNIFTSRIANDEERRRIASRAPIEVYAPVPEDTQYVADFTGDYWPYRTLTFTEAVEDRRQAERTANRSRKFGLVDTRPPGMNFHTELAKEGQKLGADYIYPAIHGGWARDATDGLYYAYRSHDWKSNSNLVCPVPAPHGQSIACIKNWLYDGPDTPDFLGLSHDPEQTGLNQSDHPTDFFVRDLNSIGEWDTLRSLLERLDENISNDAKIHLYEPPITGDLIQYIRANPGAIDSIILPSDADTMLPLESTETEQDELEAMFTRIGSEYMSGTLCPYVRVAAELSLLCSTYLDISNTRELITLVDRSVIPRGGSSVQPLEETEQSQGTLTSLIS